MLDFRLLQDIPVIWIASTLLILYPSFTIVYNLTLHPLAKFRAGPVLWRCSRLPYVISAWSGYLSQDVVALHKKFGPIVRIAPNELSFSDPEATEIIFSNKGANLAFPKTPLWHAPPPGKPLMLTNALDPAVHGRMRRKMEPSFTERSVARQEVIPQRYMSLLVEKLKDVIEQSGEREAVVNIVPWLTYVTVDIIGDLAFGESFSCLKQGAMDDWLGFTFNSVKAMFYMVTVRHYAWVNALLTAMVPKSVMQKADEHWDTMERKVSKRMAVDTQRPDFITLWTEEGKKGSERLPRSEIAANAFLISIAGSETTATTLTGTINQLVKNPDKIRLLTEELRTRFSKVKEITFAALKDLPYLNAVMWEGLRMCEPVLSGIVRISPPEGAVVCGQHVPGNTIVSVNSKFISYDPTRFHKAGQFHPERWLPNGQLPDSPFFHDERVHVQPFSIGPRSCIGKPLAIAELRLALGRLFWEFDFKAAETEAGRLVWESQKSFSVVDKKPFDVRLSLRST